MPAGPVERSVVIPAHGQAPLTQACLRRLQASELEDTEIVVVEDGATGLELDDAGPLPVRHVRRAEQSGFAAACNAGAAAAQGRELVFLNNDTLPSEGWLDALSRCARDHPGTGIVGAKLLWPDDTVQHAGVVFDGDGNGLHLYEGFPACHPAVDKPRELQAVTAAAMLVLREAFEAVGGFDASFVNGWEDVDLCLRAGEQGWKVRYAPDSVVYHLEGATRGREFEGDAPNYVAFMERWGDRVHRDAISHWAQDGLLRVRQGPAGVVLEIGPELRLANGSNGLAERLAEQTAHGLELLRDNVRLAVAAEPPADAWHGVRRRHARANPATLSVVIPVGHHGTLDTLLNALARQTVSEAPEVLVAAEPAILDEALGGLAERPEGLLAVASSPEGGRASALNRAIERASGELVLLLVDDFIPSPRLVEEHLAVHAAHPRAEVAALGPALFSAELRQDPFRAWLEDSGELFGVSFTSAAAPPPGFWYCANTSLKRSFLLEGTMFDERLNLEAWDDHELGLRLRRRGMEVVYAPGAVAEHLHPLSVAERREVMHKAGRSAAVFDSIYPRPHPFWSGTDPVESVAALEARAALLRARHRLLRRAADRDAAYSAAMRSAFIAGYRSEAWAGR